jgi:hypothetical protein
VYPRDDRLRAAILGSLEALLRVLSRATLWRVYPRDDRDRLRAAILEALEALLKVLSRAA